MKRFKTSLAILVLVLSASFARAAIPVSERQVLLDLYNSTNGASWTNRTGWLGAAGTECSWYGVYCNAGEANVTLISLSFNNLSGPLPPLVGLTALQRFYFGNNQLTGAIPPLTGLTALIGISVPENQLTGHIPLLAGLTALAEIQASDNQFSGTIPELAGLTTLTIFDVSYNLLTGSIPSLAALTTLEYFDVSSNQLSGPIPALDGLTALGSFSASGNQLTGIIPSLAGLNALNFFNVYSNQLTGTPPAAPSGLFPNNGARLCPNFLSTPSPTDAAWDIAVGRTWSTGCTTAPNYTITPSAGTNGAMTPPTPQSILVGTTQNFGITPNAGYLIGAVSGCGGAMSGSTFTTASAIADCTVSATFLDAASDLIFGNGFD